MQDSDISKSNFSIGNNGVSKFQKTVVIQVNFINAQIPFINRDICSNENISGVEF